MGERRSYRAYLLGAGDDIRSVTIIDATDDASACLEADNLLRHSEFAAVEVWDEQRVVWHSDRDKNVA
jgi:hypothetical protein